VAAPRTSPSTVIRLIVGGERERERGEEGGERGGVIAYETHIFPSLSTKHIFSFPTNEQLTSTLGYHPIEPGKVCYEGHWTEASHCVDTDSSGC
jgi:hypothetical protein